MRWRPSETTVLVTDASIVTHVVIGHDHPGRQARDRLRGESIAAPHLLDLEVCSALRRLVRRRLLTPGRADLAIADLTSLPIRRVPHDGLLRRCWELRDNLTIYDASYVALAELLEATLLTGDGRLAGAPGLRCDVEVVAT
jgi:predicted nucleic acid-binding protein